MDTPKFTLIDDNITTTYITSSFNQQGSIVPYSPIDAERGEENDVYDGSDDDGDS